MQPDVVCHAESIPFADACFDVVACRTAAHHFSDPERRRARDGARRARRVLLVDTLNMGDEASRPRRSATRATCGTTPRTSGGPILAGGGLEIEELVVLPHEIDFPAWLERTGCTGETAQRVRELWGDACQRRPAHPRQDRDPRAEGRLTWPILVDNDTRLVVQGLTGSEGRFHGLRNRAYGTQLVAGVTPGKGGQDVEGVPVFDTVAAAVAETGANTSMVFVPAPFAADAVYEAVDAGIATIICITEGVPAHDMLRIHAFIQGRGVTMIGPNCPGALSPGKANVGIIPAEIFREGAIGLVSRSGTLTYQIGHELTQLGLGNSTIVGIGGDPVVGSSFVDILSRFEADAQTERVVMVGEIGGDEEEKAAAFIEAEMSKPVVAYIAGFTAPPGKTMGHAGAIISGSAGTAQAKKEALEARGIRVGTTPTETAQLVAELELDRD